MYLVDFEILSYNTKQRSYLMLTGADYGHCEKGSSRICSTKNCSVQKTLTEKRSQFKLSEQNTSAACADRNKFFTTRYHLYAVIVNCESTLQQVTV